MLFEFELMPNDKQSSNLHSRAAWRRGPSCRAGRRTRPPTPSTRPRARASARRTPPLWPESRLVD